MSRCEDWPACMHEDGCCPDYDESGMQLNMVCTCGKKLPITNRSSICDSCLRAGDDEELPWFDTRDSDGKDIGYCDDCGEEMDTDCNGNERCPNCDDPCPCCSDGEGYAEEHDGQPDEAQEWHDFDPDC